VLNIFSHWNVPPSPESDLAKAHTVLTHEFGDQKTPSATTRAMVEVAVALCQKYNLPLICQFPGDEVAKAMGVQPLNIIMRHLTNPGAYLDTEEVNRQAAGYCLRYTWSKVILVTHPHHLWRAGKNLEHHGLTVLYPDVSRVNYDRECTRSALRSPWKFVPREIVARALYLKRGWI
jgi:uncharacterized SAM-binding protein YcdF (DUF218 family)